MSETAKGEDMAEKFKVGDVVTLKSGGPEMTISQITAGGYDDNEKIKCQWFGGRKLEDGWFPPESLVHAKDDE